MASNRTKKKGELLDAFYKKDIEKILQLLNNITEHERIGIILIVKDLNKNKKMTPLTAAILHDNYHLCKLLVEDGISLNDELAHEFRPLSFALCNRKTEIAELFIRSGADVNMLENDGESYPMFWAICVKSPPHIVEEIISAGFPVNALVVRKTQMTAIQCAVFENNLEAAEVLFKHSVDLNVVNSAGETVLNIAVEKNCPNMVKLLVKNGARLDNINASICPLFIAIRYDYLKMVEVLLDLGANIQKGWVSQQIIPPLQFATSYLNVDIIMLLLTRGANVNAKHIFSRETALHVVSPYIGFKFKENTLKGIQVKVAKALIEKGAEINAKDCRGKTPLDNAIYSENTNLCMLLLREGAEIVGTGCISCDGLLTNRFEYIACVSAFRCPELIKLCLERGSDYNYRDRHGLTPYHCILAKHSPEMVKVFWKFRCPFDQPENIPGKMKSMLCYDPDAIDKKLLEVQAEFINGIKNNNLEKVINALNKGAEPKGCSMKIPSTLHYVASSDNHKIARVLLENGVPVNRLNKKGQSALYIALQKKNFVTCQLLLQFGACFNYQNTASAKTIAELAKENYNLHKMFKKIYKCFRLVKKGDFNVMRLLQQYVESGDKDMVGVLMNCSNRKGLSLMGLAIELKCTELTKELMKFRIQNM